MNTGTVIENGMKYGVVRECCASRSCMTCWPFPRAKDSMGPDEGVIVTQFKDTTKEKAEEVAKNWGGYRAFVVRHKAGASYMEIEAIGREIRAKRKEKGGQEFCNDCAGTGKVRCYCCHGKGWKKL